MDDRKQKKTPDNKNRLENKASKAHAGQSKVLKGLLKNGKGKSKK